MRCAELSFSISAKFIFLILAFCPVIYSQDANVLLDEDQVKDAIQDGAAVYICADKTVLEFVGVDYRECKRKALTYAPACWSVVDKLVLDYALIGDESGKKRFGDIADVYTYCMQTSVLMSAIRSKKSVTSEAQN